MSNAQSRGGGFPLWRQAVVEEEVVLLPSDHAQLLKYNCCSHIALTGIMVKSETGHFFRFQPLAAKELQGKSYGIQSVS